MCSIAGKIQTSNQAMLRLNIIDIIRYDSLLRVTLGLFNYVIYLLQHELLYLNDGVPWIFEEGIWWYNVIF